ncbi:diphthine methyltransferase [Drosophila tropicalis]|uniref:diphthine methyltransferase n=1 Tax=Drosophila tropicalis TaxID=46794 RepID=UPI0035ABD7C9
MAKFRTLHSVDTEYSADSVEWCPGLDYFVCGTYQLVQAEEVSDEDEATKRRKGRIYLYKFSAIADCELEKLQTLETAAILDMKWLPTQCNTESGPLLATVNAIGQLEIYELNEEAEELQRRTCLNIEESESETPPLALALDWQRQENGIQLIVSDSRGNLNLLSYIQTGDNLSKVRSWHAHEFEAWTCAFDRWTPHRVFSGGDDGLLRAYDLRTEQLAWTNKAHMAGVTCLLSHPRLEHNLITGSYDEQVRLFDTRQMKQSLAELNVEGGVWRLKPHPERDDLILTACMYKNFSLVGLKETNLTLLGTYEEHESICYGADWSPKLSDGLFHMATCSFYDHKLCVSSLQLE